MSHRPIPAGKRELVRELPVEEEIRHEKARAVRSSSISRAIRAMAILGFAMLAGTAAPASPAASAAGIPDPSNSEADTCLVLAPGGNFLYRVVLRDETYAPVADARIVLDFNPAPGITLCSVMDPDLDGRLEGTSDAHGVYGFRVKGGGQSSGYVTVSVLGQLLRVAYPRSTDLDGNLRVDGADRAAHLLLPADARAGDYDCDGDRDAADQAILESQLGQDCSTVPVQSSTWGRIKNLFH